MYKLNLYIHYTKQTENTEIKIKVNIEPSDKQNDQSQKGMLGLVLDYLPLAVRLSGSVSVILDILTNVI